MERLLDRVARELEHRPRRSAPAQFDPARADALRGRASCSATASRSSTTAAIIRACQEKALELADYDGFRERQRAARDEGRFIGIGVANYVEGTGLGPFEGVTVRVLASGKVAVATGATNQGQGTRTTLSQIVAERARLPPRRHRHDDRRHRSASRRASAPLPAAQAVNAGCSAHDRRRQAVRKQIVALAARTLDVTGERNRSRRRPGDRARAATNRRSASAIWRGWRRAFPAFRCRPDRPPASNIPPITRRRRPPIAPAPTSSKSRSTP